MISAATRVSHSERMSNPSAGIDSTLMVNICFIKFKNWSLPYYKYCSSLSIKILGIKGAFGFILTRDASY